MNNYIKNSKKIINEIPIWVFIPIPSWLPFLSTISMRSRFIDLRDNICCIDENYEIHFNKYNQSCCNTYNQKIHFLKLCYSMMIKIGTAKSKASLNKYILNTMKSEDTSMELEKISSDMLEQYNLIIEDFAELEDYISKIKPSQFYSLIGSLTTSLDEIRDKVLVLNIDQTRSKENLSNIAFTCSDIYIRLYNLRNSFLE